MFRNYFKTAWRNAWNNKFYTVINLTGLSIGLAVSIMILFWVEDELSYDSFHRGATGLIASSSRAVCICFLIFDKLPVLRFSLEM
jgi:putative ABC transport system permease protein